MPRKQLKLELYRIRKEKGIDKIENKMFLFLLSGTTLILTAFVSAFIENYLKYRFDTKWSLELYHIFIIIFGLILIVISFFYIVQFTNKMGKELN